jgi:hypothetical protein
METECDVKEGLTMLSQEEWAEQHPYSVDAVRWATREPVATANARALDRDLAITVMC